MRKSKKYSQPFRPLNVERAMGGMRFEEGRDGLTYHVRAIPRGSKIYICPGCNGTIAVGESHVVVWTEEHFFGPAAGVEDRRHWHTSCWRARGRAR